MDKQFTDEHRANLSKSNKGKRNSPATEFKEGNIPWNKGKKGVAPPPWNKGIKAPYSDATIIQMSESHIGKKIEPFTEEHRRKIGEAKKGNKQWNYKGGVTPEHKRIRQSIDFRLWREAVFARDNWTCAKCNTKGGRLHPHHLMNFAQYPELRFAIDNGITFCSKCHMEFHKIFGLKDNDDEQVEVFIK